MAANRTDASSEERFSMRWGRSASEPDFADSAMAPSRACGVGSWYEGSTDVEQPATSAAPVITAAQVAPREFPRWLVIGRAV